MNRVVLLFVVLFCVLNKNAFALKLRGIDFDKDIYRKMNVNVGYEMQKYTGGIDKVFETAKNSSIDYKANKAGHAMNFGIGYNFYLNLSGLLGSNFLTNLIQPFIGLEATVRAPVSGNKVLSARYDKGFDGDIFGAGEAFGTASITTMPPGTIRGVISQNGDDGWIVSYFDRSGNEVGQEIRDDFAPGTVGGSIERQPDGTWTAHMVNGAPGMKTYDYPNYIGTWEGDGSVDTADNTGYSVNLKSHEYLVFMAKFGGRVFLTNNISLSPYWAIGFNITQASVDIQLYNRTINSKTTNSGFVTGLGVEAIMSDRYALTIEYRHSINKFNFASNNKLEIASENLHVKFGYYFW